MTHSRVHVRLKRLLTTGALLAALGPLAACSGGSDDEPADRSGNGSATASESETERASTGEFDLVELENYTYTLDRICQCRHYGEVEITVEDGEVTSAVFLDDVLGVDPGDEAPDELWISLNDIIAEANDPEMDLVDVSWPKDQEWPRAVYVDPDKDDQSDETFYRIVELTPAG